MSIEVTTLLSGQRNVILHVYVDGDANGDVTDYEIADPASFGMTGAKRFFTIEGIQSSLSGFSGILKFDYLASKKLIWVLPEAGDSQDFSEYGGLKDISGPLDGTGKVLLSTRNLAEGDEGSFILRLKK